MEKNIEQLDDQLSQMQQELKIATESQDSAKILSSSQRIGEIEQLIQLNFDQMESIESELLEHNNHFDKQIDDILN